MTAESPANKGYGNSVTLPYDVTDTENAHHILLSLCETVGARIRYDKAYISVVQVQIVDNEFHHRCRQLSLPSATNVTEKIYEAACNAFDQAGITLPSGCSVSLRAKQPTKAMSNIIFSIRISLSGCPN